MTQLRRPLSPGVVAAIGARRVAALLYFGPAVFLLSTIALVIGAWKGINLGGAIYAAVVILAALGVVSAVSLRQRLEQVSQALERAQRTSTVGLLTAGFAHEMKNALTVILGFAELARTTAERPPAADQKVIRHLREVEGEVRRTVAQLQSFLSYASGEKVPNRPRDVNELVKETLSMIRPMARMKELQLDDKLGEPPRIDIDPYAFRQLLLNLLLNALDFAGSKISISTASVGGGAEVIVQDDGPGVPVADRERIFQRFVTTRPGGNGLGLSTSREIAEAQGGKLTLGDGPGARFVLRIPAASP
jgi:signal transduction histidine kinase